MTAELQHIDRRTIVKGAAWSTPVLAAAMATPAFAASPEPTLIDLSITRKDCRIADLTVVTKRSPHFEVKNNGNVPIPAGTILELTTGTGFGVSLSANLQTGIGLDADILDGGNKAIIRFTEPLAPGETRIVKFLGEDPIQADVGLNRNATLSLVSLPDGYEDANGENNSDRISWSGVIAGIWPIRIAVWSCSG